MTLEITDASRKRRSIGAVSEAWEEGLRAGRGRQSMKPDPARWSGELFEWWCMGWRFGRKQRPKLEQFDLFGQEGVTA